MATAIPLNCGIRGLEMTIYINSGDDETPVWFKHLGITGDLTISETEEDEELSVRDRDRATKQYIQGETDINVGGTQVMDPEYIGFQYFYSMRTHGTPKDIMVLNAPITDVGAIGWRGMFLNKDRTFNGPATGAATQAFMLKPAACTETPVRPVKVTADGVTEDYDPTEVEAVES